MYLWLINNLINGYINYNDCINSIRSIYISIYISAYNKFKTAIFKYTKIYRLVFAKYFIINYKKYDKKVEITLFYSYMKYWTTRY